MSDKITVVVDYLNEVKTRCTYNAAAKALGYYSAGTKETIS